VIFSKQSLQLCGHVAFALPLFLPNLFFKTELATMRACGVCTAAVASEPLFQNRACNYAGMWRLHRRCSF